MRNGKIQQMQPDFSDGPTFESRPLLTIRIARVTAQPSPMRFRATGIPAFLYTFLPANNKVP